MSGTRRDLARALAAARRAGTAAPLDALRRRVRELDLGRHDPEACERAALAWLNGLATPEELLAGLVPDPAAPPRPGPPVSRAVAQRVLSVRNRMPDMRLRSLDDLARALGPRAAGAVVHLRHTGCARADPPPEPPDEIGVLLPIRIETRFRPGLLRLLVIPDVVWLATHGRRLRDGELAALTAFVTAREGADAAALAEAWRRFAGQVGGARAAHLVRAFVIEVPGEPARVRTPAPEEEPGDPELPRVVGFPPRLEVWLARAGGAPELAHTLSVDRTRLLADFPDADTGDRRWWESWAEAQAVGLGVELALPGDPGDIDLLMVTGLSDAAPAELWRSHRDAGRLGLLAPGTPTNAVDGAPAAPLGADPMRWLELLTGAPGETERLVSQALTGDAGLLGRLPGDGEGHRDAGEALVAALWPALWGHAGTHVWGLPDTAAAAGWAARSLHPEGPFPTLRVGAQPYALLPATALRGWKPATADPAVERGLAGVLPRLRDRWRDAARARGTVVGAGAPRLLDLIAHAPRSRRFRQRRAHPLELWWLAGGLLGFGRPWQAMDRLWHARHPIVAELDLRPPRRYGARGYARRVELPLVVPEGLAHEDVRHLLKRLLDVGRHNPAEFGRIHVMVRELLRVPPDSVLLRLVMRSLQVALAEVGRETLGEESPAPEAAVRFGDEESRLQRWLGAVEPGSLGGGSPAQLAYARVEQGIAELLDVPLATLERALRATIDTAGFRIDPWIIGLSTRRLTDLLDAGAPLRLGAYGWVDRPRPGSPGPTPAGLLLAPSPAQALTATVLRDRAVNDAEPARWDMDLDSASVRTAERIAAEVRLGAHVAEALGREVERVVGSRADVERLRRAFPVREEHDGRRVLDGLRALAADPAALGLDAGRLAALAPLRAALEAYGDLLVAEAVHHVTEGRAEVAGAVMDAAAGLARPPELGLLRTPRQGRGVATSAVLLLPAVEPPPEPADPLERALLSPAVIADPSAAAFIGNQLGAAGEWRWIVTGPAGPAEVTLADLGLLPADALALSLTDLQRLAAEAGGGDAGSAGGGAARYEAAARLVGLVGRAPAGPDALGEDPAAVVAVGALDAELAARYARLHATALLLAGLLVGELAAAAPDGSLGAADAVALTRLLTGLRAWGIAPDPPEADAGRRLVAAAARGAALLGVRLDAAPDPTAAAALPRGDLVAAMAALASPTGQLAVTARVTGADLPPLTMATGPAGAALGDWLSTVAAVRPALAAVEAHQLAAGTPAGAGPPLRPWSTRPADPWQRDAADARRMVVAFGAAGLDPGVLPAAAPVAAAALDRFSEVVPETEHTAAAAFGFDAPGSRPPQAVLLAVPPAPGLPLDARTLAGIVAETRELAHARMARPADLDAQARVLLPTVMLPGGGPEEITLDPTPR